MRIDQRVQSITLVDQDAKDKNEKYLLSYNGQHYKINHNMAVVFYFLKQYTTTEDASLAIKESGVTSCTPEQLDNILNKFIYPIFSAESNLKQQKQFIYKKEILSKEIAEKFTVNLSFLFNPKIMYSVIGLAFILDILFFITNPLQSEAIVHSGPYAFLTAIVFLFASILFHELGHVSACRYYNIDHGGIGIGLYINMPVFYSDVTNAWLLCPSKRLVVNIAGVYFQLLIIIPILILHLIYPNEFFRYMIIALNINFLFTLNPFFKFDGYWIVSDALGVANLRSKTQEILIYFLGKIRRQKMEKPAILQITKVKRNIFIIYSIIMNLFFAYFFMYIIPVFTYRYFTQMPAIIKSFVLNASTGHVEFHILSSIVTQTALLLFILYMLYKFLFPFMQKMIGNKK